jgi:hypothetical protein
MPITTPDHMIDTYDGDEGHFEHVLECMFVPAITRAGLQPIPPKSEGADVIHGEIVANLETAALVLCDISCLNPNVFFELGCRTALNKPVCYVKDDQTPHIPFDTGIINHHTYQSSLKPWQLPQQVETLAAHISTSQDKAVGKNSLWQYFGLSSTATPTESPADEDKLDYLVMQMDVLKRTVESRATFPEFRSRPLDVSSRAMPESDWKTIEDAESMYNPLRDFLSDLTDPAERAPLDWVMDQQIKQLSGIIETTDNQLLNVRAGHLRSRYRRLRSSDCAKEGAE